VQVDNENNLAVDMSNNLAADGAVRAPVKEDGSEYTYCLYYDTGSRIVFSDNLGLIVSKLIPGYLSLKEPQQELSRVSYLRGYFSQMQLMLLEESKQNNDSLSDEQWAYIMNPDRVEPVKSSYENFELLVLGDSFSDKTIGASTEEGFLRSLDRFNIVSFYTK
jgi:hypothetical protein